MIGYVTLGTNDRSSAVEFYDALLALVGARRLDINDRITLWSGGRDQPMLGIAQPYDGHAASAGNGAMVALNVGDKAQVEAMHEKALAQGAVDEGAVGLRGKNFYGGYFRDADGNKLVVYCIVS